jgi:hypothetical protein
MQRVSEQLDGRRAGFARTVRSGYAAGLLCGLCAVAGATADVQHFYAVQDVSVDSSFTLDFGDGVQRSANITTTQYTLEADALVQTSRFLSYHQTVNPLVLPGGSSTGDMIVTIQESLAGPYDPEARTFSTQDMYLIYFTGDLSAYGLSSPVALPGSASGTITYSDAQTGIIVSHWSGLGQLEYPSGSQNYIPFMYTCDTQTTFTLLPEPGMFVLLGLGALLAFRRR